MKLLIVTSFFPTSTADEVPQFLLEQVHAFIKHKPDMKIKVLTSSRGKQLDCDLPHNVTVDRFSYFIPRSKQNLTNLGIMPAIKHNKMNILQLPFLFIVEFIAIIRTIIKYKPDYIYSHWFLPQGVLCHICSLIFSIPHLFTSHSYDVEICKKIPFLGKLLVRSSIKRMQAISVVSERTQSGISCFFEPSEWSAIKQKCRIIPMGINFQNTINAINSSHDDAGKNLEGAKVILFMGRFVEKKGINILLEAFARLQKKYSDVTLVLAGNGTIESSIKKQVAALELENHVRLPGFITNNEKRYYLSRADIYVLPSIESLDGDREGLPVSLLESMSYGNICIATKASGAGEVIEHTKNGFLVESNNINALFEVLDDCYHQSQTSRNKMKLKSQSTAELYRWENVISKQCKHFFD